MNNKKAQTQSQFFSSITYCILDPKLTEQDTVYECQQAKKYHIESVIVKPCYLRQAVTAFRGSDLSVGTVIGFPHGSSTTYVKMAETKRALTEGAQELSVVIHPGYLNEKSEDILFKDLETVSGLGHMNGVKVNAILNMTDFPNEIFQIAIQVANRASIDRIIFSLNQDWDDEVIDFVLSISSATPVSNSFHKGVMGTIGTIDTIKILVDAGFNQVFLTQFKELF